MFTHVRSSAASLLRCAGSNDNGELGRDGRPSTLLAVNALEAVDVGFVSCGAAHAVALSEDGRLYGWGQNAHGQLASSDREPRPRPRPSRALRDRSIRQVAVGEAHMVMLDSAPPSCPPPRAPRVAHGAHLAPAVAR